MSTHSHKRTILLVEDNEDHAELVRRAVDDQWQIKHLQTGEEAIEWLLGACQGQQDKEIPDLILLDWRLDNQPMQGIDVLHRLKKEEDAIALNLHRLPIVILTTSDDERDVCQAFSIYANSYLVKPPRKDKGNTEAWKHLLEEVDRYWHQLDKHIVAKPKPGATSRS